MDVRPHIDINCDLGEGFDQDGLLFPLISSCSIACGGHAGDADSMKRTIDMALQYNVQIGAHPSYPDRENFGRVKMDIGSAQLFDSIGEQFLALSEIARKQGAKIHYLKPHGALYNVLNKEAKLSEQCLSFLGDLGVKKLLGLPNTILQQLTRVTDISYIPEGFADRAYTVEGHLVLRSEHGAIIESPKKAAEQVQKMILDKAILSIDGQLIDMDVKTVCIHSDTPSAHKIALALNEMFEKENIERRAF